MALSGGKQHDMPSWAEWQKMLETEGENTELSQIATPKKPIKQITLQLTEEEKEKQRKRQEEDLERRKQMRELMKHGRESKTVTHVNENSRDSEVLNSSPAQKKKRISESEIQTNVSNNGISSNITNDKVEPTAFKESPIVATMSKKVTSPATKTPCKESKPSDTPLVSSSQKKKHKSPLPSLPPSLPSLPSPLPLLTPTTNLVSISGNCSKLERPKISNTKKRKSNLSEESEILESKKQELLLKIVDVINLFQNQMLQEINNSMYTAEEYETLDRKYQEKKL